jgi:hypothetical protein
MYCVESMYRNVKIVATSSNDEPPHTTLILLTDFAVVSRYNHVNPQAMRTNVLFLIASSWMDLKLDTLLVRQQWSPLRDSLIGF